MVDLTWEEYRDRRERSVVLVPLGAVEQHGPHLPLDTDTVVPTGFAMELATRLPAIVAPSFAYGYKSQPNTGGGERFPGTTSFDGATFTACVRDLVRQFARDGVRALAFVNGNYENTYFAIEGIDLGLRDIRGDPAVRGRDGQTPAATVLLINWWEQLSRVDLDEIFAGQFPGWEAEHAGVVETSLLLHFDPARAVMDRVPQPSDLALPTYTVLPEPDGLVPPHGVLRSAKGASPEIGRQMAERVLAATEAILRHEFRTVLDHVVA